MGSLDPACFTCDGELFINSQTMHTYAFSVTDLQELINPVSALRGSDVIIPGASGRRAYPRRVDETSYSLPFAITGVVDKDGNEYSDWNIGRQTNLAFLETIIRPDNNTQPASITLPNGSTVTADVFVVGFQWGNRAGPLQLATLDIVIPAGRFA